MDNNDRQIHLQRIANHLIINSSFLENLGLFHGKMGIVIFFYHYSRYTNNPIYDEFAGELLDEIFEEIHDKLPIDFENGYLGIGWGIQYLAEQKFISGDINDILEEIDKKIMERDVRRISDMSLGTGLEGVFHYVLSRQYNKFDFNRILDKQYINELYSTAKKKKDEDSENLTTLCNVFTNMYEGKDVEYVCQILLNDLLKNKTKQDENINEWKLGLIDGCVNVGLTLMLR